MKENMFKFQTILCRILLLHKWITNIQRSRMFRKTFWHYSCVNRLIIGSTKLRVERVWQHSCRWLHIILKSDKPLTCNAVARLVRFRAIADLKLVALRLVARFADETSLCVSDGTCSLADIVFALDSSGSIGGTGWQAMLDFVVDVIMSLRVEPQHTQVMYLGHNIHG